MQEHERRLDMPEEVRRGLERSQAPRGPRAGGPGAAGPVSGPSSRAVHWIEDGDELSDDEDGGEGGWATSRVEVPSARPSEHQDCLASERR